MYSRIIEYTNYDGKKHKETLNFELNIVDIIEMNYGFEGGVGNALKHGIEGNDTHILFQLVQAFVLMSYGKLNKSKTQFNKSTETKAKFINSRAYGTFMNILFGDKTGKEITEFLDKIIPNDVKKELPEEKFNFNAKTIFDDLSNLGFKLKKDKGEK